MGVPDAGAAPSPALLASAGTASAGEGGLVVARAPGKLFVAGEYAVLDAGRPAVLVAVDRYVSVAVTPAPSGVEIVSDLGARARLALSAGVLGPYAPAQVASLTHVAAAVGQVAALALEHGRRLPPCRVRVASGLHEEGRKYGLGSSGAVTVAAVQALAAFAGLDLGAWQRLKLALVVTAGLDRRASGGDVAAATFGGWIGYRSPDRAWLAERTAGGSPARVLGQRWPHLAVGRLPAPRQALLKVGWTGSPAASSAMVAGLDASGWRDSAEYRLFVARTGECVSALAAALAGGDGAAAVEQVAEAGRALERLDRRVGLGVFTPRLRALVRAARRAGGAGKPSGAGGGDCGIALLPAAFKDRAEQLAEQWTAAGVLPLPLGTAAEGNRECQS
ncbi:phosphomevalonate kinase [Actinacidiphila rubida]|uniref:phosphomevalonate kinase n=1 Tax=Actinacidiphila rubida TaxID=310780 RepID=UPI001FE67770|nr:phosphomevalonate kinase [Actinacidiphila rubida]